MSDTLQGLSPEQMFVKRCVWKGRSEAVHYGYLAAHGVPTPQLFRVEQDADGYEVIFLERLERKGFDRRSESEWHAMLSLLARLNACPIEPEHGPHLHSFEHVGRVDGGLWVMGLDAYPSDEQIQESLLGCGIPPAEAGALVPAAQDLFRRVAAQPQGLLHQDFLPDNLGWRGRELVVFDLHKLALGPRFADVAGYLAQPDWSNDSTFLDAAPDSEPGSPARRESFARHYLREYARYGGPEVSLDTFLQETTALFWAHTVAALPWLKEHPKRIEDIVEYLRQRRVRGTISTPRPSSHADGRPPRISPIDDCLWRR